jgi:RNA polymerase sigma-70 factor (family 1)
MTEKNLIKGLKEGAYSSYETLFKLYYVKFVYYAKSLVGDLDAAKDLVQEAFMKVWLNRKKLREELSIHNYLFVLVRRASLNFIRDRKNMEVLDPDLAEEVHESVQASSEEKIKLVKSAVDSLPAQRKAVFKLSREEGLRNKEIAEQLNLSEKTVERHMTLALRDLRNKFKS